MKQARTLLPNRARTVVGLCLVLTALLAVALLIPPLLVVLVVVLVVVLIASAPALLPRPETVPNRVSPSPGSSRGPPRF